MALIDLQEVYKAYQTDAGGFMALKGITLGIEPGEFIGVIGKSGSGKSTLINMITGIDRPTSGEVWIGGHPIHTYNENQIARWRRDHIGIIFQFFQLLPGLTVLQNVTLPLDLNGTYHRRKSRDRAMALLERMDIGHQAHKRPTEISGGQQQRVAIARALINDPPLIVADEPTGSLDSKTAERVFQIFTDLVEEGRTILIVTHDDDQAQRVGRTVLLSDGELVNEWVARALPTLHHTEMMDITRLLDPYAYEPGEVIIEQGSEPDNFYIITEGAVDVWLTRPDGSDVFVERLAPGTYFGEMALLHETRRTATVRAADAPVKLVALDREEFEEIAAGSEAFRTTLSDEAQRRAQTTNRAEED